VTTRRTLAAVCFLALAAVAAFFFWGHRSKPKAVAAAQYADSATCVQCHADEAAGYARTGMAHSFYLPTAQTTVDNPAKERQFYHAASDTYYELTQHDGKFYEHRWQKGFDGKPSNVEELPIDYIMGSGNHVRTFLHREQDGTLIELPMAWYAEDGGHWGMNPGYDNAHPMTRRPIAYECMFCHNGYPEIPPTAHRDLSADPVYTSIPLGIDCQRCHGPGEAHVRAARTAGMSVQNIDSLILNPVRLSKPRKMEVCEQCHLETTSQMLPDRIRRYDQEPFGYDPNHLLEKFNAYFSRDPQHGSTDNFEINSAPYRLRQSQCYIQSHGALTCETCHDPHDLHKGPQAATYYANICMKCHGGMLPQEIALGKHPASGDCVSCHMPKRRTEDVVHVVMTDHLIQRYAAPASQRLAPRQEEAGNTYRGPVKRYLLDGEKPAPVDALYDADAQVIDGSNVQSGIPELVAEIQKQHPAEPNFSIELGDAERHSGDLTGAIAAYRDALKVDPLSSRAQRRLGVALGDASDTDEAISVLTAAIGREPANALLFYERGLIESRTGSLDKAMADFRQALALKPEFADAENNLGSALAQSGDPAGAEAAFHTALDVNPYDSDTQGNLGRLLAGKGDWPQAAFHLEKAVDLDASNMRAHSDYAVVLLQLHRVPEAEVQARAAVAGDAKSPREHDLLGQVLVARNQSAAAKAEFEAALQLDPNFGPAQLDLAETLIGMGQAHEAELLLEQAERSPVPGVGQSAHQILQQLGPR
jgi:tetratricopeptide (TPR) repeat protein